MGTESRAEEMWRSWLEPFAAVRMLVESGIGDQEQAINWLKGRLTSGEMRVVAWSRKYDERGNPVRDENGKAISFVVLYKISAWKFVRLVSFKDDFWISGTHQPPPTPNPSDFDAFTKPGFYSFIDRARFEPTPIKEFCDRAKRTPTMAASADADAVIPKNQRRGAKRKDWWDHLWIEMIRRIISGTLSPSSISELQEILETHASHVLGVEPGDSTLKPMASNLFKYLQEASGKIGKN